MNDPARITLPNWPRLMPLPLAAAYLGIGQTTLRKSGLEPKRIGARIVYDRTDLDRWADSLSGQPLDAIEREAEADDIGRRISERLNDRR
jgi:hypothetical protein